MSELENELGHDTRRFAACAAARLLADFDDEAEFLRNFASKTSGQASRESLLRIAFACITFCDFSCFVHRLW